MDIRFGLLLACFFLSGFAALLYETAWTRELSFVFGTSELAVAAVLAAYMGGLALGAAAAGRFVTRLRRPVLVYGVLELAIALCALSVPTAIRGINALYGVLLGSAADFYEVGASAPLLFQLGAAFAVLLPPTALMGATLPLLARHAVRTEAEIGPRVGVLYAVNTTGAIAGTLCAAFLLMPEIGLRRTVWTGAAVNAAVFGLAALLARGAPAPPVAAPDRSSPAPEAFGARWILPAIALSGSVSFAYEVLWTRLLGQLIGGSVQAFSTMLASFLLGIALGSSVGSRLARTRERAALGFAVAQLGIAAASYTAFWLADRLPELSKALGAGPAAPGPSAALAVAVLLPITLCIGATFPCAVRLLALRPEQAAGATARVFAWNTVGAIAGALAAGFVLLPGLRFVGTLGIGVAINLALAALVALAAAPRRTWAAAAAVAGAVVLAVLPLRTPWNLLLSSPLSPKAPRGEIRYAAVGRSSTVLMLERGAHFRLSSNGLPEAATARTDVVPTILLSHWLGFLPALVHPDSDDLLVVGLGGGSALEFVPPSVSSIDVIELEPEVRDANLLIAEERAIDPLSDPRVRILIGDARGALRLTAKRYDAIVSQPSHPWTAGASHLYTREFFSLVRSRLEPNGVFAQWIGPSFIDEDLLRALVRTLLEVFPHLEVYQYFQGLIFVAADRPVAGLEGAARAMQEHPEHYAGVGLHCLEDFARSWVLSESGAREMSEDADLNTDDHNLLASRSAGLGDAALDPRSQRELLRRYDALLQPHEGIDRVKMVRRLVARGVYERATDVAMAGEGAEQEAALGWVELAKKRQARAARHFSRARELDPDDREALAGLVGSRRIGIERGAAISDFDEDGLDAPLRALVAGWRAAARRDWDAFASLDAPLAAIGPCDPLFDEASHLRIRWRIAARDPAAAAEAMALTETLMKRDWNPGDSLLHAEAAIVAGRSGAAWGSLLRIADELRFKRWGQELVQRSLALSEDLPDEMARELRLAFASRQRAASGEMP